VGSNPTVDICFCLRRHLFLPASTGFCRAPCRERRVDDEEKCWPGPPLASRHRRRSLVSDVLPHRRAPLPVTPLMAFAHGQCSAYRPLRIQRFSLDPDPWPLGWTAAALPSFAAFPRFSSLIATPTSVHVSMSLGCNVEKRKERLSHRRRLAAGAGFWFCCPAGPRAPDMHLCGSLRLQGLAPPLCVVLGQLHPHPLFQGTHPCRTGGLQPSAGPRRPAPPLASRHRRRSLSVMSCRPAEHRCP